MKSGLFNLFVNIGLKPSPELNTLMVQAPYPLIESYGAGSLFPFQMDLTMLASFNAKERSLAETVVLGLVEINIFYISPSFSRSDHAFMLYDFHRAKVGLKFETFWDCCDSG